MGIDAPLLDVRELRKEYTRRRWFSRERFAITALDGVNLRIDEGSTLVLVGESGAGKSTLARCIARLEEPSSGQIWFQGENLSVATPRQLRSVRRKVQMVFQDPGGSFNPRFSASQIIEEPWEIHRQGTRRERRKRARELMEQVGLASDAGDRLASEFSGGQRQRLALARALALKPRLLILDEAFSGLDLSIQAQMLNLLRDLQDLYSLTCLYICHDLSLAAHIADEVAVMQRGKIVERSSPAELFRNPQHPHTKSLLESLPAPPGT